MTLNWSEREISVKNTSGEDIPPFALMELVYTGNVAVKRADDGVTSYFEVKKPTIAAALDPSRVVVNSGSWIRGDYGIATVRAFGHVLLSTGVAVAVGDSIGAVPGQWYAVAGGNGFHLMSEDYASAPAFQLDAQTRSVFAYRYNGLRVRRHWIGYLYESYRGVVVGFWVVPTLALDGLLPPFSRVYVYNIYKWNFGKVGATVRVEEDKVNNRWIALIQEYVCPDSSSIPPQTPPPLEDGTEDGVA